MKSLTKLFLFLVATILSTRTIAQVMPISLITCSTLTDLRALQPQASEKVDLLGLTSAIDGNGGTYIWNPTSTITDDGFLTIQVTGITTGRWIRIGSGNTIKGNVTSSGISLTTSYTVSYSGGTLPFTPITVLISPRSLAAAGPSYVSSITTTGFTVNFVLAPTVGVNNLSFDYIVVKQ